jgi:hypothetical protein
VTEKVSTIINAFHEFQTLTPVHSRQDMTNIIITEYITTTTFATTYATQATQASYGDQNPTFMGWYIAPASRQCLDPELPIEGP